MTTSRPPIAVVGVSALFPGSTDGDGFWRDILAGRDLITDVPASHWLIEDHYDPDPSAPDKTYARRGGFLKHVDFDALAWGVPPSIIPATDTSQLLALIVAEAVLRDATGSQFETMDRSRISCILGVTSAQELLATMVSRLQRPVWSKSLREHGLPESEVEAICQTIADHYQPWQESSFPGLLGNVVAGRIANRLDLGGTNCVTDAACASTFSALSMAVNELYLGDSDLVITGGVDTLNDIFMFMCFSKTPALSLSGDVRPFSDQADGTMLGEGLGMVALKRLDDAERDGDRVYAVIRGVGSSSDGRSKSVYAPVSAGQALALTRAYDAAGFEAQSVELIEAHGTGTKAGDAAEFGGLQLAFGPPSGQRCALGTVKSQIGHTKAAAGAGGLFKAVMALHHKVLPPTIKVERPNPALELESSAFYLNTEARPWVRPSDHPRRAGVSSFGFGGSNFHVALEEYTGARRPPRVRSLQEELVLLSGATGEEVAAKARALAERATPDMLHRLAWESVQGWDGEADARLALVAGENLRSRLLSAAGAIEAAPAAAFEHPGTSYGVGPCEGDVAFLFPGQGSQYVGMGADLAMAFDVARGVWDRAAELDFDGERIDRVVMPIPRFNDAERAADEERLRSTEWAQPGIGCASLALLSLLRALGVTPSALAGHSFGELMALHAAGVWNEASLLRAARGRGELMAQAAEIPGGMLAVSATVEQVGAMLDALDTDVVIANHNAPKQVVVSGPLASLEDVQVAMDAAGLGAKRIPVATAFHSPVVAGGVEPFARLLAGLELHAPTVPVLAGETASDYEDVAETLARQIAEPVRWADLVCALADRGVRTFVEVGPGSVLTGLVGRILEDRPHTAIATDRRGKDGVTALLLAVARLAALGVSLDPTALWADCGEPAEPSAKAAPKLAVPINGANHDKLYPPPGGAKDLPPPNPERTDPLVTMPKTHPAAPALATPTPTAPAAPVAAAPPAPAAPMIAPARTNPPAPGWLGAWEEAQRQNSAAHTAFQQAMAQSHVAFLQTVESSFQSLSALAGAPLPSAQPLASTWPSAAAPLPQASTSSSAAPLPPLPSASVSSPGPAIHPLAPAPAVPAATPPPAPSIPSASPSASAPPLDLHALMLAVVADKTGYPADMLDASMDLEGDLGIDSIKRVEILAAVQDQAPGMPDVDAAHMGSLRTLGDIVGYMQGLVGSAEPAPAVAAPSSNGSPSPSAPPLDLHALMLAVVAHKTGYPGDMLDASMDLEGDLGIDSIKRVEILAAVQDQAPGMPDVDAAHMGSLRTLGDIVGYMQGLMGATDAAPAVDAPSSTAPVIAPLPVVPPPPAATATAPLGRYDLVLLDRPALGFAQPGLLDADEVVLVGPIADALAKALNDRGVLARAAVAAAPDDSALVFLGGLAEVTTQDEAAAVAREGFCVARTVSAGARLFVTVQDTGGSFGLSDLSPERAPLGALAALVKTAAQEWPDASVKAIDIARADRSEAELAAAIADELLLGGADVEVALDARRRRVPHSVPREVEVGAAPIRAGDVVVVSGGARGVTSACVVAWARATQARFVLLGRSVLQPEPSACEGIDDDAGLKRALLDAARGAGETPSPQALQAQVGSVLAGREIRTTLAAVQRAGAEARYASVDVTDRASLEAVLATVRSEWGPIRGLVHGAGVLADRRIAEQTDEQFDRVWGTKIAGLGALLGALQGDPLALLCLFSSVAARCGNSGQVAYAMANEALNKIALAEAARRPDLRVRSLGWGPWQGGMVSSQLAAHFAEMGVPMIPLDAGALMFVEEMSDASGPVELVLGGEPRAEALMSPGGERRLDLELRVGAASHPYLRGHTIDSSVVVPVALVAEWFARLAGALRPDLGLDSLHDVAVLRGVRLPDFEARGERLLLSARQLSNGHGAELALELHTADGTPCYRARATMRRLDDDARPHESVPTLSLDDWGGAPIYGDVLFHRDDFQVIRELDGIGPTGISGTLVGVRAGGWGWERWTMDVAAIDGALQLALLWARQELGGAVLPMGLGELRIDGPVPEGAVRCVAHCASVGASRARADVSLLDAAGRRFAWLKGVELVLRPDANTASELRA